MKFRDLVNGTIEESPVGQKGRTTIADAQAYISDDLVKEFQAIVKKLGGKTVATQLLGGFKPSPKPEVIDASAEVIIAEENEELSESRQSDISKALKGMKSPVGVDIQGLWNEYYKSLIRVSMEPSSLKDYLDEAGIELSQKEKDAINKAIDACGDVIKILK